MQNFDLEREFYLSLDKYLKSKFEPLEANCESCEGILNDTTIVHEIDTDGTLIKVCKNCNSIIHNL